MAAAKPVAPTIVTTIALAKLLGLSERMVRELGAAEIVVPIAPGRYDVMASVSRYCHHLREKAAGRDGGANLTAERAREARERADNKALINAKLRRELLPADDVEREWQDILRRVRGGVLSIPSRVQQKLPSLSVHEVTVIDREVRESLREIGEDDQPVP